MDDSRALVPPPAAAPRDRLARSSRRVRRAALVSTIALAAGLTCRDDNLTGPGLPSRAHLAIVPTLQRAASAPVVTLARARARVTTIPAGTVLRDTVASFPADGSALSFELVMTLTAPSQLVELHLSGITAAGDTVYASFDTLTLVANATAAEPLEARLEWVAPDTAVKAMRLFPRDTTFRTSEQAQFRVVAKKADSTVFASPIVGWTSTDTTLATFSADGRLTAKGPFANLRVIAGLGSGLADTTFVSAVVPVASVVVAPDSVDLFPGDTIQLVAQPRDAANAPLERVVAWSALDANVVVSTAGQAVVSAEGVARVVAAVEGKADTAKLVVRPAPVASVVLPADSLVVVRGDTSRLVPALRDRRGVTLVGRTVTWRSTSAGVTVDGAGLVTGALADAVGLVIASSEGKEDTVAVRVARRPVARVDVAPDTATLLVGASRTFAATPRDAAGAENRDHPVSWASADDAIATVSAVGVVAGAAVGSTIVRATAGGVTGGAAVTVVPVPVRSVVVTPATAAVLVGATVTLDAATRDSAGGALTGRAVSWRSLDEGIAVVVASATGASVAVRGVSAGTARIVGASEGFADTTVVTVSPVPVASVDATPDTYTLRLGGSTTLAFVAKDSVGGTLAGRPATWSSNAPTVASVVAATGVVTGASVGTAYVVATVEGKRDSVLVTVTEVPIASVIVSPETASIVEADSVHLTAAVADSAGAPSGRPVLWSSANPAVATVDAATGWVKGASVGSAYVRAALDGKSDSALVTVLPVPVASVDVMPATLVLRLGQVRELAAAALDAQGRALAGRAAAWLSRAPAVASVDGATGLVSASTVGVAWVVATVEGRTDSSEVTVTEVPVTAVTVTPDAASVFVTDSTRLTVSALDSAGNPLVGRPALWASRDASVASVDAASGWVRGVGVGSVYVVATVDGSSDSAHVTVVPVPVRSVVIAPDGAALVASDSVRLTATARDSAGGALAGRAIAWRSLDEALAVVRAPASGASVWVVGVAPGTAHIVAESEGVTDTVSLAVSPVPVAAVSVAPEAMTLQLGATGQLAATALDARGNTLAGRAASWVSRVPGIATVGASTGLVTAAGIGATWIVATIEGHADSAQVTVTPVPVASVDVTPATLVLRLGQTRALTASALDAQGQPLTGRVASWVSRTPAIVSVDAATGVVTAAGIGAAWVVATVEGSSDSTEVTVTAVPVAAVTVAPREVSVLQTDSVHVTATALDSAGGPLAGRPALWASRDASVASVDAASGWVRGVGVGSVYVVATVDGRSDSARVTVSPVPVARVDATPDTLRLVAGDAAALSAAVYDSAGGVLAGRAVSWTSLDGAVASVDGVTGLVRALQPGATRVVAASEGHTDTTEVLVAPVPVASVEISPALASVVAYDTLRLAATPRSASGAALGGRAVVWRSLDPSVLTVGADGLVTGEAEGVGRVEAAVEGRADTAAITVTPPPVATVVVSPDRVTLRLGQSAQLSAASFDARGRELAGRAATWLSREPAVASVAGATGIATASSVGAAWVVATVEGRSDSTEVTVTEVPVAAVSVAPDAASLFVTDSTRLTASVLDSAGNPLVGRAVTWTSADAAIAAVDATGRVRALAVGSVYVLAEVEALRDSALVTVVPIAVAFVDVAPDTVTTRIGRTATLTAVTLDSLRRPLAGRAVDWATRNPDVASVDAAGVVTGLAAGTAVVVATSEDRSDSAVVVVTPAPVARLQVSPDTVRLVAGDSAQLSAAAFDSAGAELAGRETRWESADTTVAAVDAATGRVRGVRPGAAYVRGSSEGAIDSVVVLVATRATALVILTPDTTLEALGDTVIARAEVRDAEGAAVPLAVVAWATLDAAVASVGAGGEVAALANGVARIVATSEGGVADTLAVTVRQVAATASISPPEAGVIVGESVRFTVTAADRRGNAISSDLVRFASSTPGVATVDEVTGVATGVSPGAATISASGPGIELSAGISVQAPPPQGEDATAEFFTESNPSPNGRWRAGWTATLGSPLNLYTQLANGTNWLDPSIAVSGTPAFWKNLTGATLNGVPNGMVSLHPGCRAGELAVLRWTAGETRRYALDAQFFAGNSGETGAYVLRNGREAVQLFSARSTSGSPSYSGVLDLSAGEMIDFVVTPQGDCLSDDTPIAVRLVPQEAIAAPDLQASEATAEPASARPGEAVMLGYTVITPAAAGPFETALGIRDTRSGTIIAARSIFEAFGLGAGATSTRGGGIMVPADAEPGSFYEIVAVVDCRVAEGAAAERLGACLADLAANDELSESDETNNVARVPFTLTPLGPPTCSDVGSTPSTSITSSQTWTKAASPHRLSDNVTVSGAGTVLTIEPGALVCMPTFRRITVTGGARLYAVGAASDSIRFVPEQPDQPWGGIHLDGALGSPSDSSVVKFVRNERGSFTVENGHRATLEDLYVWRGSNSDFVLGGSSISFVGSVGTGTRLTRAVSDSSHTNGVLVSAAGALVEGVKVRWTQGYAFEVHGPNNRLVGDTAIAPCMIGVYLEARESSAARNVELRGVHVEGAATLPGCASFNRQSVAGIQAYGDATVSSASTPPRVTGGTGDPFAGSIAVFQVLYPTAAAQDALLGNVNGDTVDLQETLIGGVAVARPEVPWRVSRTVTVSGAGASLQALPGASLAMGNGASLVFQDGGRVVARGTPARPVLFTAARSDQPWRGIELRGTPSENSYLVNAVLERGSSPAFTDAAAVVTYDAHRVTIDSSLFRLMAGDGRRGVLAWAPGSSVSHTAFSAVNTGLDLAAPTVVDSSTFDGGSFGVFVSGANVVLRGNVFTRNASDAIHFNTNVPHNPTIAGNRFEQNGGLGVNTETGEAIDARLNYWGDDAGPFGPNGDGVAAGVLYDPWLRADGSVGQPPVTSVAVTPTPSDVEVGRTVQLTATTTPGGRPVAWSTIDAAVATVDASGLVTGVAPGTARIIASAESVADTATVNVAAVATVTWLGGAAAAPTAWETAANWRPARVPTPDDTARIGPTANVPRLVGPATIGGLAFAPGGALAFQGATLTVTGDVDARGTVDAGSPGVVRMTGAGRTLAGTLWAGLEVAGDVSLADATRVTRSVDLSGAGRLRVNGRTLEIDGTLDVDGGAAGAALVMTNPQDSVVISGLYASFAGASTETLLTAGTLVIAGRLQQADDGAARGSFAAGPAHRTVLVGTTADTRQLVQFQSPGPSHFGQLLTRNAVNEVVFQTDAHVAGAGSLGNNVRLPSNVLVKVASDLQLAAGAQVFNEGRLQFCGSYNGNDAATVGPNQPISCGQPYRVAVAPDSVDVAVGGSTTLTPTIYNAADSILAATPLWRSLDTDIVTVSPAGVVSGVANGVTLVIAELGFGADTTKVVVGTGVRLTNIAEWVGGAPAAPNDWQTAANWRPAQVPLATDTVVVRAGSGFVPTLSAATQIGGLRVESSAAVDLGGNGLVVTGSVETGDEGGVVGESAEGVLALAGSGTIRGRFSQLHVGGAYAMSGDVGVSLNTILSAPLTVNGRTLNVGGGLGVAGNGALVMQNPADQVNVTGFASFQGDGNEGLMTAGTLTLYGDFSATNGSAFIAGPQHRTQFQGSQAQTIAFLYQNPGPSHFGTLVTQGAGVSFLTNAQAAGPIDLGGRVTIPDTMLVKGAGDLVIAGIVDNFGRLQYCGTLSSRGESGIGPNPARRCDEPYRMAVVPDSLVLFVGDQKSVELRLFNLADSLLRTVPVLETQYEVEDARVVTISSGGSVSSVGPGSTRVSFTFGGAMGVLQVRVLDAPPAGTTSVWTGTQTNEWAVAANWRDGRVPGASDAVWVPSSTLNAPALAATTGVASIALAPNAVLDVAGQQLVVGGSVDVRDNAAIATPSGAGGVQMTGTGTLRGTVPALIVSGDVTLNGRAEATGGLEVRGAGRLALAGRTMAVLSGRFDVRDGARVVMTNPLDSVLVSGSVMFGGASHAGLLTAGVLAVGGANVDLAGGYVAQNQHKLVLTGDLAQVVRMTASGQSLQHVEVAGGAGGVGFDCISISGNLTMAPAVTRRLDFYGACATANSVINGRFLPGGVRGVVAVAANHWLTVAESVVVNSTGVLQGSGKLYVQGSLRTAAGSFVAVENLGLYDSTGTAYILGNLTSDTLAFVGSVAQHLAPSTAARQYQYVQVGSTAYLSGRVATGGGVYVFGRLDLTGQTLDVGGPATLQGVLTMSGNGARVDSLLLRGDADFRPEVTANALSRGVVAFGGSAVIDVPDELYHHASRLATFKWLFNGATGKLQSVSAASAANVLGVVEIAPTALVGIQTNLFIRSSLDLLADSFAAARMITAAGTTVDIGYDPKNDINNGSLFLRRLVLDQGPQAALALNGVMRVCNISNYGDGTNVSPQANLIWTCPIQ